jgi:hypothetical protein
MPTLRKVLVDVSQKWNTSSDNYDNNDQKVELVSTTDTLLNLQKKPIASTICSQNRLMVDASTSTTDDFMNDLYQRANVSPVARLKIGDVPKVALKAAPTIFDLCQENNVMGENVAEQHKLCLFEQKLTFVSNTVLAAGKKKLLDNSELD